MRYLILIFLLFSALNAPAQIQKPLTWSYAAKRIGNSEAILFLKADLQPGWHVYSTQMPDGGPVRTTFKFIPDAGYTLLGAIIEPMPIKKHERAFDMDVFYFEKSVIFQQKIQLNKDETTVKGKVLFMACNDKMCLPPSELSFEIPVK